MGAPWERVRGSSVLAGEPTSPVPDDGRRCLRWCDPPMTRGDGWSSLFTTAFTQSRNAMALVDVNGAYLKLRGYRRDALIGRPIHEVVVGGPNASAEEWARVVARGRVDGEAELICAEGGTVNVSWGASAETVTGRTLVLFVALATSRRGRPPRRAPADAAGWALSMRQR